MREAVGTTWIFQLVIIFILIFAAYLALTINYSRAFMVKNESLTIIEKHEGLTSNSIETVNGYLKTSGYKEKGDCPLGWYGISDLDSTSYSDSEGTKYYWCFTKIKGYNTTSPRRAYYKIKMFFRFELPVIGPLLTYDVDGKTYEMDKTYDDVNF